MGEGVAVVICTRDRPELLRGAIDATVAAISSDAEIVVVDSASRDASAVEYAHHAGLRVVRVDRPGLSRARNAGIAATTAPLVAFTDDDCRPASGWTRSLARPFGDPRVGFATGRVEADRDGRMSVSVMVDDARRRMLPGFDPFLAGVGANMAVRRVACAAIAMDHGGPFDERLGAGVRLRAGEDVDVWWRLLQAGWHGAYEPQAVVTHQQWRTEVQAIRLAYGYGLGAGALATKAMRDGRDGGAELLGRRLWTDGVLRSLRDLRNGYQTGAVFSMLQTAGTVAGAVHAARWPTTSQPSSSGRRSNAAWTAR